MLYEEHAIILSQAAELLAGNEWANLDSNFANRTADQVNLRPDGIFRAIVTTQCPAATKTTGPPVEWEAGLGGKATMYQLAGRGTATDPSEIFIDGSNGQTLHLEPAPSVEDEGDIAIDVVNFRETSIDQDEEILLFLINDRYCVFPLGDGGGGEAVPKRVKFVIDDTFLREGVDLSGYANATVIDPMNSGLSINDQIVVWDYKKQFITTKAGAIGIAIKGNPYGAGTQWHVEECEMLVDTVRATMDASLGPWMGSPPSLTNGIATSSWPYVIWDTGEPESLGIASNRKRLTANTGDAWLKRVIPDSHLPEPSNTVAPYTLSPISTIWEYTEVEFPTARWVSTIFDGTDFVIGMGEEAEGSDPLAHDSFSNGMIANPPSNVWDDIEKCTIKLDTAGWAFLDDNVGEYKTIVTASSLFGLPEKVSMVAKLNGAEADNLINPKSGECAVIEHEQLINALVWGNPTGEGTGCKLDQISPKPSVDVLANANDVTVVTGTEINEVTGELEFTTKNIKACDTVGTNLTLPYTTQDVITDLDCGADSLEKSYRTIKFIGSSAGGSDQVSLPCTNPNNYDWQFIFENHIYDETWWNVSYYDITWPSGCEPCPDPVGCCTGGSYDGQDVTEDDCILGGGSWSSSPCGEESCCDTLTVSQADFGVPTGYTSGQGDIGFTPTNLTSNGSCSWVKTGNWTSNFDGATPAGTIDITYDESTSIWDVIATLPAPYGGTLSGSYTQEACTTQAGTVIDIPVAGTHSSYSGNAPYAGTIRISFTQSA